MKDLFETDRVFLPKPDTKVNYEKMCFGEARFFKSKFWKLHVIMGFEYTSLSVIQNGFSFFNSFQRRKFIRRSSNYSV